MTKWPKQSECDAFYGNPRGKAGHANPVWEAQNLVYVTAPFAIFYDGKPIPKNRIRCHKKCKEALSRVLDTIWEKAGRSQAIVNLWGMSDFSGSYNYRQKRGSKSLSMHAYGCAFDFDADRNAFQDHTPEFAKHREVLAAWASEDATWGGSWIHNTDGMHWQFAVVG